MAHHRSVTSLKPRREYGDRRACKICGTDIEWLGRAHGWRDRGGDSMCGTYEDRRSREFVYPVGVKHKPYEE